MIKDLALEMLHQSLNDVCSKEEDIPARIKRYSEINDKFSAEWLALQEAYNSSLEAHFSAKERIRSKISSSNNEKKIQEKIDALLDETESRMVSALQYGSFVRAKVKKIQADCDLKLSSYKATINTAQVEARLKISDSVWDNNLVKLQERFDRKEEAYYNKRVQEDRVSVAAEWFVVDFEKVLKLCRIAEINVLNFYREARVRLNRMKMPCKDIDALIEKIKAHEF